MDSPKRLKTLIDENGEEYVFNAKKFSEAIDRMCRIRTSIQGEKRVALPRLTKQEMMERIADKAHVSFDAVKKWKGGNNSPGSIDMVHACESTLGLSASELLTPLVKKKGVLAMQRKEISFVEEVYAQCIGIAHDHCEKFGTHKWKEIPVAELNAIHRFIDCHSLGVEDEITYQLHRIVMELGSCLEDPKSADRWYDIVTVKLSEHEIALEIDWLEMYHLQGCVSRSDGIHMRGVWYLNEEISFAEKMGLLEDTEIPNLTDKEVDFDGYYAKENGELISEDELSLYGYHGMLDIDCRIVYCNMFCTLIKRVFQHDFPNFTE